ncbi:hypothetical protein NDU88_003893 [Pleurodeles waltl]|uniref:Uncharacterized protein n=1 Tax=Pleurodeles waltl TaxID=8319 RepID=A0AAV7NI21_PLEWA|nr:hypothetical protein NDU88_003893 [Pleurodeles waltl]
MQQPGQNERLEFQEKHGSEYWNPHQRPVGPGDWCSTSVDPAPGPQGTERTQPRQVEVKCASPAALPVRERHDGGALTYAHCWTPATMGEGTIIGGHTRQLAPGALPKAGC